MISGQWLTAQDVAQLLHVRIETVRRWIRQGELPVLELGSPRTVYRIRPADLDQFVWQRYRSNEPATGLPGGERAERDQSTSITEAPTDTQETHLPPGTLPAGADLQSIVDRVPAVTFRESPDQPGVVAYMSPAIEKLLGHPARLWHSDLAVWLDHVHPDDRAIVESEVARMSASGGPFRHEYRMIAADGRTVWIAVDADMVPDDTGGGRVWEGVIIDISDRKQMESALGVRDRQQRAVADLGMRALRGDSLDSLMDRAVRCVSEGLDMEYSRIFEVLPGGESLVPRAALGWKVDRARQDASGVNRKVVSASVESQVGYTLAAREPVVSEDLNAETRFDGPAMVTQHGVRCGLSVTIAGRGRPYGVIGTHSARQRTFSQEDVYFLKAVANVIASAVARSDQRWLTVLDVATHLQVTEDTVRRWIRHKELPALNLGGPRAGYRVYPSDLERFINERVHRL